MNQEILGVLGLGGGELLIVVCIALLLGGIVVTGLAIVGYFVIRSLREKPQASSPSPSVGPVAPVPAAKQPTERPNLVGSRFQEVNLSGAEFDDVNLTNARFHNVNLSNVTITAAQMGGATFKHVGPPPDAQGKQERQRPVRFEEMMLCDSTFRKVDLSNVRVIDCDLTGMTVNGVLVTDLLAAYSSSQRAADVLGFAPLSNPQPPSTPE